MITKIHNKTMKMKINVTVRIRTKIKTKIRIMMKKKEVMLRRVKMRKARKKTMMNHMRNQKRFSIKMIEGKAPKSNNKIKEPIVLHNNSS